MSAVRSSASGLARAGLLVLAGLFVLSAACGGGENEGGGIELLDGELADTVPADFPLPPEMVVSASLINRNVDPVFTEVSARVPAGKAQVRQYFETSLPAASYEIASSSDDGTGRHVIVFAGKGVTGELALTEQAGLGTTIIVRLNPPPG